MQKFPGKYSFTYFEKLNGENPFADCYGISQDEIAATSRQLAARVAKPEVLEQQDGMQVVLADGSDPAAPLSRLARTLEYVHFKELPVILRPYETNSTYLMLFDYGSPYDVKNGRLAHIFRLLMHSTEHEGLTGLETVDKLGGQVSPAEILAYHGIDSFENCMNISSNLAVPGVLPTLSRPYGLMMYRALFELMKESGVNDAFTELNPAAVKSLGRLGLKFEPIGGRTDLQVPPVDGFTFDEYTPVRINCWHNQAALEDPDFAKNYGKLASLINKWHIRIEVLS